MGVSTPLAGIAPCSQQAQGGSFSRRRNLHLQVATDDAEPHAASAPLQALEGCSPSPLLPPQAVLAERIACMSRVWAAWCNVLALKRLGEVVVVRWLQLGATSAFAAWAGRVAERKRMRDVQKKVMMAMHPLARAVAGLREHAQSAKRIRQLMTHSARSWRGSSAARAFRGWRQKSSAQRRLRRFGGLGLSGFLALGEAAAASAQKRAAAWGIEGLASTPKAVLNTARRALFASSMERDGAHKVYLALHLRMGLESLVASLGNGQMNWLRVVIRNEFARLLEVDAQHVEILNISECAQDQRVRQHPCEAGSTSITSALQEPASALTAIRLLVSPPAEYEDARRAGASHDVLLSLLQHVAEVCQRSPARWPYDAQLAIVIRGCR
jgi:hypothetical protein